VAIAATTYRQVTGFFIVGKLNQIFAQLKPVAAHSQAT
jgi:hypothetical protein